MDLFLHISQIPPPSFQVIQTELLIYYSYSPRLWRKHAQYSSSDSQVESNSSMGYYYDSKTSYVGYDELTEDGTYAPPLDHFL